MPFTDPTARQDPLGPSPSAPAHPHQWPRRAAPRSPAANTSMSWGPSSSGSTRTLRPCTSVVGRSSTLRHDQVLDGCHSSPDEATEERAHRDRAQRSRLQPDPYHEHHRHPPADRCDQGPAKDPIRWVVPNFRCQAPLWAAETGQNRQYTETQLTDANQAEAGQTPVSKPDSTRYYTAKTLSRKNAR